MRHFLSITIIMLLLLVSFGVAQADLLMEQEVGALTEEEVAGLREEIFQHREQYLTVGSGESEFRTIAEAVEAVTEERNVIWIMDAVHTEVGIELAG